MWREGRESRCGGECKTLILRHLLLCPGGLLLSAHWAIQISGAGQWEGRHLASNPGTPGYHVQLCKVSALRLLCDSQGLRAFLGEMGNAGIYSYKQ